MPPLQQVGPAASNEFTSALYYAPPPQQPLNAFAAFWHGFLATRNPWARELFSARLRAMDPSAKANALLALEEEATKRFQAQEASLRAARQSDTSLAQTIINSNTQLGVANIGASETNAELANQRLLKQTTLSSDQQKTLFDAINPSMSALREALSGDVPDEEGVKVAISAINGALDGLKGQLDLGERGAVDRLVKTRLRSELGAEKAFPIVARLDISATDDPLEVVPQAGGVGNVIGQSFDQFRQFGVNTDGGGSAGVSTRGPTGGVGGFPGVGPATGGAPPLTVSQADMARVFDSNNTGLRGIGDAIFTRERRGTRRKREAIEKADPRAQVALAVGASGEPDPLDAFLGGFGVAQGTRSAAQQLAGAQDKNKTVGGAAVSKLRPTLADEEIAEDIDVSQQPVQVAAPAPRELARRQRFDKRAADDMDDFLAGDQGPRAAARTQAFDEEFQQPVGERRLQDVRQRTREFLEEGREADELVNFAGADDLDDFLPKRKKKKAADAR